MVRKVFRSRITWFIVGVLVGVLVIPNIPAGTVGEILKFLWSQKWGVLIGAAVILFFCKVRKGLGFRLRVEREESPSRR